MGRRTAWLLVLCAVAAVLFLVAGRGGEQDEPTRAARRLIGLRAAGVRAVKVRSGPRLLVARRAGRDWRVLVPAGAPAEARRAVEDLVAAVARTVVIDTVPRRAEPDPAEFGLDRPRARIVLLGRRRREVVLIGDNTPAANALYAGVGTGRRLRVVKVSLLLGSEVERALGRARPGRRQGQGAAVPAGERPSTPGERALGLACAQRAAA